MGQGQTVGLLDRNGWMLFIDCFQIICYKLGGPLSEETTEGLVKFFYAPQIDACLVTISKLHNFVQLTRDSSLHVYYIV